MKGDTVMGIFTALAALFGSGPVEGQQRPDRSAILKQAVACGLKADNLSFTTDSDGVANADVYPIDEPDDRFFASAECLGEWSIKSRAAVSLHFQPRSS